MKLNETVLSLNPLKPKNREREDKVGGVAIGNTFNGGT
jgi:hypothetical protein